ncbi:MAG: XRE family transcriptional regulator [Acidobacteria bacterium]|nr:MAG: XRE family transcriptional regulator [Acidobacteriota bacterium]
MNDAAFGEFQGSLKEALAHAKGERADLRVTGLRLPVPLPAPPKPVSPSHVARIRQQMHISQSMFARFLNVSVRTVQDWEQGRRTPSDAALRLLELAEKHPDILLEPEAPTGPKRRAGGSR